MPEMKKNIHSSMWITNPGSTVRDDRPTAPGIMILKISIPVMCPGKMWPKSIRQTPRGWAIKDGDTVKLTSPSGSLTCTVKLWEGVRPGTIAKCYGQGHWAYGRVASKEFGKVPRGGSSNDIIPAQYDRLSGSAAFYATTRIKIEKV